MIQAEEAKKNLIVWKGMQPSCSLHSFSLSCPLSPSLLKDAGRGSANGLWLFVYMQFVRGLAPFPPFKEVIYHSIHVYLPHSDGNT